MENHYFDKDGFYLGSAPANPGSSPPANAIRTPPRQQAGFRTMVAPGGDGWELVPEAPAAVQPRPAQLVVEAPEPEAPATRQFAYRLRADPLRDEALSLRVEAEGWALSGQPERARKTEERCRMAIRRYLKEKEAIRREFPRRAKEEERPEKNGSHKTEAASVMVATERRETYFLAESGVYHDPKCRRIGSRGKWLREDNGRLREPQARPCRVCQPPMPEACRE